MAKSTVDGKTLSKGQIRKLNALRKSLGDEIAEEAFAKWLATKGDEEPASDPNIELIERALLPLADKIRIPRGTGYIIRRGRGRFIVELVGMSG